MAKRIPLSERPDLIRKPDDWARDWGWVSRRRAKHMAGKLNELAWRIENALDGDPGASAWATELRQISRSLAPAKVPAEIRRDKRDKVAAMREA